VYIDARTPIDRTAVVARILNEILESGARFIKKDKNTREFYVMSKEDSHDKIGHSIRDMINRQRKKAKKNLSNSPFKAPKATTLKQFCTEPMCYKTDADKCISSQFSKSAVNLMTTLLSVNSLSTTSTSTESVKRNIFDSTFNNSSSLNSTWDLPAPTTRKPSVCINSLFSGIEDLVMTSEVAY
jgi:hypothetical protein